MSQKTVCFIFARGGSKGLPGKNIKPLADIPLIAHAINCAKNIAEISEIIVSTDDEAIAKVARDYGADVPFMRPERLASDDAPEWLAWQHAVNWYETTRGPFDCFLSLPATAPLRSQTDVVSCIKLLSDKSEIDGVITVRDSERSPYFNMVVEDEEGHAKIFASTELQVTRRQDVPPVFDILTVAYAARPKFILSASGLFSGKIGTVKVPAERGIDIDTEYDFGIAEYLISKRKVNELRMVKNDN